MRFSTIISLGLALVATASAVAVPVNNFQGITTREASPYTSESLQTRDVSDISDLEARAKVSLSIPKKLEHGHVSQKEVSEVLDLGEDAMKDHKIKKATVVCGWHIAGSSDKKNHFTIEDNSTGKRYHVYDDGTPSSSGSKKSGC